MRTALVIVAGWSVFALIAEPTLAASLQVAKVYRDYPGYINPTLCENPNMGTAPVPVPETQNIPEPLPPKVESAVPTSPAISAGGPQKAPAVASEPGPTPAPPMTEHPSHEPVAAEQPVKTAPAEESVTVVPAALSGMPAPCDSAGSFYRADNPVNVPYATIWAGMVATNDTDLDAGDVHADLSFDNGWAGGLAVGYDFGPARIEVEGGYRNSNIEHSDEDLEIRTLMLNAYADFKTGGITTPYLGAGVGYAQVEVDGEDDGVMAGQLGAGVLFAITPSVAVDLGYRFMMTEDPDIGGAEFEVRQHTALLGLQVRF